MTTERPKFFTFIETVYPEPAAVPERIRNYVRVEWLNGASVEELAKIFNMPVEWVDEFVRAQYPDTKPN
jgi:hypothetical protein